MSNSTPRAALPPLPEPRIRRPNNLLGPATGTHDYWDAEQVEQIRRETVQACAAVCNEQAKEPECPERAAYCADAILALLPVEEPGDA